MGVLSQSSNDQKLDEILKELKNAQGLSLVDGDLGAIQLTSVIEKIERLPKTEEKIDTILEMLKILNEKYDKQTKKDAEFKRKLELTVSQIREYNKDLADKMDEMIREWNDL